MDLWTILLYLLDTPEKYWIVVGYYHIHKGFWGMLLTVWALWAFFRKQRRFELLLLSLGIFLLLVSAAGNWYTEGEPSIKIWSEHKPRP